MKRLPPVLVLAAALLVASIAPSSGGRPFLKVHSSDRRGAIVPANRLPRRFGTRDRAWTPTRRDAERAEASASNPARKSMSACSSRMCGGVQRKSLSCSRRQTLGDAGFLATRTPRAPRCSTGRRRRPREVRKGRRQAVRERGDRLVFVLSSPRVSACYARRPSNIFLLVAASVPSVISVASRIAPLRGVTS